MFRGIKMGKVGRKCRGLLLGRGRGHTPQLSHCFPQNELCSSSYSPGCCPRRLAPQEGGATLPGPQRSLFSGAVLVSIRAPELCTGPLTGHPHLACALPGNNLPQFIRKHWKARRVWSKPDSGIPFMQKATYTQDCR